MSSRKNRLSLSKDIHKDKDAKTPISRRTSTRTAQGKPSPDVQKHGDNYEVSPSQSSDYSPMISLTQDTSFPAINGVSWEWNSPQRIREKQRVKIAAVPSNNHHHQHSKPLKPKYLDVPDTTPVKKPTGFNKFISKLNLLMEKENVAEEQLNAPISDPVVQTDLSEGLCFVEEFFVESDTKQSVATTKSEDSDDDIFQEHVIETPVKKSAANNTAAELDDSKLDSLLIEASQTIEEKFSKPESPPPRSSTPSPPQPQPAPRAQVIASHATLPIEMNDSDMDGFLVQASLMVEEKLSDSSQESSSNGNAHPTTVNRTGAVSSNHHAQLPPAPTADKWDAKCSTSSSSEGTREVTMSQEELKALIEKKRQEALRRLQNNRLKRGMNGANTHG